MSVVFQKSIGSIKSLLAQRSLAPVVTIVALTLLLLHIIFPNISLDSVTIMLLIVAAVPRLGQWIKSIEVAGVKLELHNLKEQLNAAKQDLRRIGSDLTEGFETQTKRQDAVLSRVERIEALLEFSGREISGQRQAQITKKVRTFLTYMRERGALFGAEPGVHVVEKTQFGQSVHYNVSTNQLVVAAAMVAEDDSILRECCFRVFHEPLADAEVKREVGALVTTGRGFEVGSLMAGLGFYFVCSFKGESRFVVGGQQLLDLERPEVSFWAKALALGPSPNRNEGERLAFITAVGDRWAHVLWGARTLLGRELMDEMILETWNELNVRGAFRLGHAAFRAGLIRRLAAHDDTVATAMDRLVRNLLSSTTLGSENEA